LVQARRECPSCAAELLASDRFCRNCGAAAGTPRVEATEPFQPAAGRPPTPAPTSSQRFDPGYLVGSRFRIVTALGKGGMGEVFRADDLSLGQSVALKFLPRRLAKPTGSFF
jgi:serine/threonine-protein kinase